MRRDNFQKIVVSSGVSCLLTDGEKFQSLSKSTDSLIQRKQLVGKKCHFGFFPFPSPCLIYLCIFQLHFWHCGQENSFKLGWCCCGCVFLEVRKALVLIFPSFRISGLNYLTLKCNLKWSHSSVPLHRGHPSCIWGASCLPCWLVPGPCLVTSIWCLSAPSSLAEAAALTQNAGMHTASSGLTLCLS